MKKNKKNIIIIISIIALLIICAIISMFYINKDKLTNIDKEKKKTTTTKLVTTTKKETLREYKYEEINFEKYLTLLKEDEKNIVFITKNDCMYCGEVEETVKSVANDMKLPIYYIYTDKLTEKELNDFSISVFALKNQEWGVPALIITKNGDSSDLVYGYLKEEEIKEFFENNDY